MKPSFRSVPGVRLGQAGRRFEVVIEPVGWEVAPLPRTGGAPARAGRKSNSTALRTSSDETLQIFQGWDRANSAVPSIRPYRSRRGVLRVRLELVVGGRFEHPH